MHNSSLICDENITTLCFGWEEIINAQYRS